jgi:hypothetical protein
MPRSAKGTTVRARIDRMVQQIVKKFQPEQVILFGSRAATLDRTAILICWW